MNLKKFAVNLLHSVGLVADPYPDTDGFDISLWNESGALINWPLVATDPRKFKFCWVKCGEGSLKKGDPGAYDYAIYERQMKGAESIGLEANPYWFWYYHLPWTLNPNAPGGYDFMILDPTAEAEAFVASMGPFASKHPLLDIEDPYVGQFLVWSDTASANKALAFARKVNASLKKFAYEVWRLCGNKPDIYSGDWWMRRITKIMIDNGLAAEVAWMKEFNWYLADYEESDGLAIPPGLTMDNVIAWQYKSTVKIDPIKGIPNGDRVDMARWVKTQADFDAWTGKTTIPEAEITVLPDITIPQSARAKILTIRPNQKYDAPSRLGVDAVILSMGGMAGTHLLPGHWLPYTEETFQGRAKHFIDNGIRVIGSFTLDPGALLKEQHDAGEIDGLDIRRNYILDKLISAWHDGSWNWDSVLAGQGKWIPISAIELQMVATDGFKGAMIPNDWQGRVFRLIVNHLRVLMTNKQIPVVPVIIYSGPWWLKLYGDPNSGILFELAKDDNKKWLWLRLGEWVFSSTSIFKTLSEIFAFRPPASFRFGKYQDELNTDGTIKKQWQVPDGYRDRVIHEYTGEAQRCDQITKVTGEADDVNLSLFNSNQAALFNLLPMGGVVVPPPVDPTIEALKSQIAALQADILVLQAEKSTLLAQKSALETEITGLTAKLATWNSWYLQAPKG